MTVYAAHAATSAASKVIMSDRVIIPIYTKIN
jgi:hypothetical protein